MNIYEKLSEIQCELKAPKNQRNNFGGYNYRSCEDILEAVKPLCKKYKAVLTITDDVIDLNTRFYIVAIATLTNIEEPSEKIVVQAQARESETKKGMDDSQITGATSSYARKYCLNGLFNIDDNKDFDTPEKAIEQEKDNADKTISSQWQKTLRALIEKNQISTEKVLATLNKYGYKRLEEIKVSDYAKIGNDLGAIK